MSEGWSIFDSGPGAVRRGLRSILTANVTNIGGTLTEADMVRAFQQMREQIDAGPPPIRCFRAHHSVPYGRTFRQWNTRGDLEVWVNRGEIADLPRRPAAGVDLAVSTMAPPGVFGIPVYTEP